MYPEDYSSIKTKFYLKKYLPTHFKQTILCLTQQKEIIKKVPLRRDLSNNNNNSILAISRLPLFHNQFD